jgi:hypothetical protein
MTFVAFYLLDGTGINPHVGHLTLPGTAGPQLRSHEVSGCRTVNLGHPNGALQIPRFAPTARRGRRNNKKEKVVAREEPLPKERTMAIRRTGEKGGKRKNNSAVLPQRVILVRNR